MIADVTRAAFGIAKLARFDAQGFLFFGHEAKDAWRSFLAMLIVAPMHIMWTVLHWSEETLGEPSLFFIVKESLTFIGIWLLLPVVLWHVIDAFDRAPRFAHFVCTYNWAAAYQNAIFLMLDIFALGFGASSEARGFFGLVLLAYLIAFGWFIARGTLQISGRQAVVIVAVDFMASIVWELST